MDVELSYCVVSAGPRQLLRYCLDAVARERAAVPFATELLVLDDASSDDSAEAARAHAAVTEVVVATAPRGRAAARAGLVARAGGRFCLLLNESSQLEPGATAALHAALAGDPCAAAAGATLVEPDGTPRASAWRRPGVTAALLATAGLYGRAVVQSRGARVRRVGWAPAAALLVRRQAIEEVGSFDAALPPGRDGADLARRLARAGWHELYVPDARAVHHAGRPAASGEPRLAGWARRTRLALRGG